MAVNCENHNIMVEKFDDNGNFKHWECVCGKVFGENKISKKTYKFFEDPGHGWLEVPFREIEKMGMEKDISGYSYINGDFVYLEEDCDASLFFSVVDRDSVEIQRVYQENTPIRNYRHYHPKER